MYVRIRTVDGKKEKILTVSKLTFIEDLKVIYSIFITLLNKINFLLPILLIHNSPFLE